jgi:hypothetical protein
VAAFVPTRTHKANRTAAKANVAEKSSLTSTLVIGLIILAVLAAVYGGPEVSPPGPVLLVGDSLLWQSSDEMTAALAEDGWETHIQATPGAGIAGGGFTAFAWPQQLDKVTKQLDYEVAIVELGTNGCDGCPSVREAIDNVMKNLHDVELVMWIDARRVAPRPGMAMADQINKELRDATDRWDNLEVLSLEELLQHSSGSTLIEPDGVHLTPAGQLVLTGSVRDELRDKADIDK